ncbi:membrane protein [Aliidongia dinghuensis]|uniref:Membrane protein n=1 Tax=Aliidongia dinghuensis TaxID=1867774 RepID=A0A8J3E3T2_9PROT|nr:TonB-dependent receptor [Aliidongia dinghuensis]GGF18479.1 membrane protein [Aliidongia dinghuensis]
MNSRILPIVVSVATLSAMPGMAPAQDHVSEPQLADAANVERITVVGTSPLPGTGIDIDKIPGNTQSLSASDLTREGSPSVITALTNQLGSVSINDNLDDPFQPDILYRGFEASPVLGTPQGLAVYQSGVRINEAFGDAVNWDLFPDIAIDRVNVVSSNPVYGLNALGGAVVINMKDGFNHEGGDVELSGGSFGRRSAAFEYGVNDGIFGAYVAGHALDEDGWRQSSPNSLRQLYADFSARSDRLTLDLSFTGANNRLFGGSATPVQELAVSRSLLFTSPQSNFNQLEFVTLNGSYRVSDALSVQGSAYYREFRQTVVNGNTTNFTACTAAPNLGSLCQSDGLTPATTASGQFIPDLSQGGALAIGENDFESIRTVTVGGSLQATETAPLFGLENHLTVGATIDHASTDFQSSVELGTINSALRVGYSGFFVATPEDTPFNATPVSLGDNDSYYSVYATDTLNVTPALAVTTSGRFNVAQIDLIDRLGNELTGQNRYSRFNPAIGATDKLTDNLTAYFGYSEANRTPTASEIECSNPLRPCLLPSSLASDPPNLKQVVSHTYEVGLRGRLSLPGLAAVGLGPGRLSWNASLYRTDVDDDIYGIATSLSSGFFQNIGGTRRQGAEVGVKYQEDRLSAYLSYSYVDATFQSSLTLPSASNPSQDANGNIQVKPGDHLPGIPQNRIKFGADYRVLDGWNVGATVSYVGEQFYRGDESNQLVPIPDYVVVNLHSTYQLTENLQFFVTVDNAINARYATFGVLGNPTGIGAPGIPATAVANGAGVDNRFQSPAAPIAAYGGMRISF